MRSSFLLVNQGRSWTRMVEAGHAVRLIAQEKLNTVSEMG